MKRVLVLLALLSTSAVAGGREPATAPSRPTLIGPHQLNSLKDAAFDRAFMGWFISNAKVGETMANSTMYGAMNTQVKAFGRQVKTTRSTSIARLRGWGGGQFAIIDIVGPQKNYDEWFLTYLPRHNEQLRQLLNLVPSHTRNANLRQFAAQLHRTLEREDAQSSELLKVLK